MSVYLGTELLSGVATNTISNGHTLFDYKWTDHTISSMEWTRSDTFSWQDGEVYVEAFAHLEADFQNGTDESETIGSYTIDYVLAPDGHKIVQPNMETTVANIYAESGVAWYYVLDRVNDRFKLPRTKFGFEGFRDTVGKYIEESIPNHYHIQGGVCASSTLGRYGNEDTGTSGVAFDTGSANSGTYGWKTSTASNSSYKDSAPVQQRATQMYLYFYVGQFSQSATEQTAGLNSELFNGKVDLNAANLSTAGKSLISSLGMPSDRYIDLTLGADSTEYTAPANGYVSFSRLQTANGLSYTALLLRVNNSTLFQVEGAGSVPGTGHAVLLPVKKGDIFMIGYGGAAANLRQFRFIYAEGEPNV